MTLAFDTPPLRLSVPDELLLIDAAARTLATRRHPGRRWDDLDRPAKAALRGDAAALFDTLRPYLASEYR